MNQQPYYMVISLCSKLENIKNAVTELERKLEEANRQQDRLENESISCAIDTLGIRDPTAATSSNPAAVDEHTSEDTDSSSEEESESEDDPNEASQGTNDDTEKSEEDLVCLSCGSTSFAKQNGQDEYLDVENVMENAISQAISDKGLRKRQQCKEHRSNSTERNDHKKFKQ